MSGLLPLPEGLVSQTTKKAVGGACAVVGLRWFAAGVVVITNCAPDLTPFLSYFWPTMSVPSVAGARSVCQTTTKVLLLAHEIDGWSGMLEVGGATTSSAASGTPAAETRRSETP